MERGGAANPAVSPWLIALTMVFPTFMVALDTSVANVALPHIAGSLSASTNETAWMLTSYLIANAIILPATAWLSLYFGRKFFLIFSIVSFTAASAASGAAPSLEMLIIARFIQGATGGALLPVSQAILLESFPREERGQAMAVYAMGVIVAPVVGPTLGGWITDNYSWRWIFYINIPFGLLAALLAKVFVEDPEYLRGKKAGRTDYAGFVLMALGLAALQVVLDKGQEEDWFSSSWITWFAVISAVTLIAFIIRELRTAEPVVDLRVLADRNFGAGMVMAAIYGAILYGTLLILPLFLEDMLGYPALNSGLAISPRGIGAMISVGIAGRLLKKIDGRFLIGAGFLTLALANSSLGGVNLQITSLSVALPNTVIGMAMGMIFVPLTTVAVGTLRNEQIGTATGLYNLMRNLGGSVGIAAVSTMLSRDAQVHQAALVSHLTPFEPAFQRQAQLLQERFFAQGDAVSALKKANGFIYQLLDQQVTLLAYIDNFHLLAFLALTGIPLTLLLSRVRKEKSPAQLSE